MSNNTNETVAVAEHHAGGVEAEPFYATAEFWVFAAFVIVVVCLYKKIKSGFISAMRLHAEKVKDKLAEARSVRNEVQAELVKAKKQLKYMQDEIASIVEKNREEAVSYKNAVKRDYMNSLRLREEKLKERIGLDEIEFRNRLKTVLIDKSFAALDILLAKTGADDGVLIHNTIIEFAEVLQNRKPE